MAFYVRNKFVTLDFREIRKLQKDLLKYKAVVLHKIDVLLMKRARTVLALSRKEVPVRYGNLKASGGIVSFLNNNKEKTVIISYGELTFVPYAFIVHERVVTRGGKVVYHKKPTKGKYLQDPFERVLQEFDKDVGEILSTRL